MRTSGVCKQPSLFWSVTQSHIGAHQITISHVKEDSNTFHTTSNTLMFINEILIFWHRSYLRQSRPRRPPPLLLKQCRGERLQTRKPTYRYSYHTYRPIAVRGRRVSSVHFCYARIFVKLPASMPKRINAPIVLLFRRVNASMSKKNLGAC